MRSPIPERRPALMSGFSLLETLLCLALLAGVATVTARVTIEAVRSVERSSRMTRALAWASSVMDLLQASPPGHLWVSRGGALDTPLRNEAGTWFADVGDLQVRWKVDWLSDDGLLLGLEVVVVSPGTDGGHPVLARLHGVKEVSPG